jgi:hypothetical protein
MTSADVNGQAGRQAAIGLKINSPVIAGACSKLLNMRDFRAASGFPLAAKTEYNTIVANRREHRLGQFPPAWPFMPHGFSRQGAPLAGHSFVPTCCGLNP